MKGCEKKVSKVPHPTNPTTSQWATDERGCTGRLIGGRVANDGGQDG